jgi:hypothetical protein
LGREIVRLPFLTPRPVPEPLRVIVNRTTDRQERQRYRSARTLSRALEGWLQVRGIEEPGRAAGDVAGPHPQRRRAAGVAGCGTSARPGWR